MEGTVGTKGIIEIKLCVSLRKNFALFAVKYLSVLFLLGFSTPFYSQETSKTPTTQTVSAKSTGKVSHKFKAKGCATVIIISTPEGDALIIPKTPLAEEFNVNGLEIRFDYRLLRAPSPKGCPKAHYAVISNLSKK